MKIIIVIIIIAAILKKIITSYYIAKICGLSKNFVPNKCCQKHY